LGAGECSEGDVLILLAGSLRLENQRTLVLVLGAGSSFEVGLPLGSTLKEHIVTALSARIYDPSASRSGLLVNDAIRSLSYSNSSSGNQHSELKELTAARRQIADALPLAISIDNYIDSQRGNKRIAICGKLAIAACIFYAEEISKLFTRPDSPTFSRVVASIKDTWYMEFYQRLTENCTWADLPARLKQVAIISFNYDRTIEHFLHGALSMYFAKDTEQVAKVLNENLEIFHPYGTIGKLPWQNSENGIAFGASPSEQDVILAATILKTFTEGVDPNSTEIDQLRSVVKNANQLVFLGFAYHRLNLDLLIGGPGAIQREGPILGTAHGISSPDREEIVREVRPLGVASMTDFTCRDLFRQYQRRLSFR
jgi:hypothetical protein